MHRKSIAIILSLPLAACGSGGKSVTVTNASASEVAAKVDAAGADIMVSPGRWEGTATINMKMPGLPPEQQARLANNVGRAEPLVSCVTPEQVKDHRAFFNGSKDMDKSCRYDHFTMSGGAIDAVMTCATGGHQTAMTMKGAYGADHYHVTMTMDAKGDGPMATMTSTTVVDAKRVGACRGDEKG